MSSENYRIFEWDWKSSPDWEAINSFIYSFPSIPIFHEIKTGRDSYAVLIAARRFHPDQVQSIWQKQQ